MTLLERQAKFSRMLAELILWAYSQGYEITMGDVYATSGHKDNSFHYKRLAADLNLFRDGNWLDRTEDHAPLGHYWESLGGTWGGRFKRPDGCHYSYGEGR